MIVTKEQLQAIGNVSDKAAELFLPYINQYNDKYEVNTPERMSAFLAQVLHESGLFKWVHELSSGEQYEGREDLGNTYPGDGKLFKGRGLIQITGRYMYGRLSKDLFGDDRLVNNPDVVATPSYAVLSAFWFWAVEKKLNPLSDAGDFEKITRRINGGLNGQPERLAFYNAAKEALQAA